jgi:hypothetical protein
MSSSSCDAGPGVPLAGVRPDISKQTTKAAATNQNVGELCPHVAVSSPEVSGDEEVAHMSRMR